MDVDVRISNRLVEAAKIKSKIEKRTLKRQIEYWAELGKLVEENPDLSYIFLKEILLGLNELESGQGIEYKFG